MKRLLLIVLALLLSSCRFHLRGEQKVPFSEIGIDPSGTPLAKALQRELAFNHVKVVPASGKVYTLHILKNVQDRIILSLDAAGQVREYQLRYRVSFRLVSPTGRIAIPLSELNLSRIMSYDVTEILAKTSEADLLNRNMVDDAANQILRRLGSVHTDEN